MIEGLYKIEDMIMMQLNECYDGDGWEYIESDGETERRKKRWRNRERWSRTSKEMGVLLQAVSGHTTQPRQHGVYVCGTEVQIVWAAKEGDDGASCFVVLNLLFLVKLFDIWTS